MAKPRPNPNPGPVVTAFTEAIHKRQKVHIHYTAECQELAVTVMPLDIVPADEGSHQLVKGEDMYSIPVPAVSKMIMLRAEFRVGPLVKEFEACGFAVPRKW